MCATRIVRCTMRRFPDLSRPEARAQPWLTAFLLSFFGALAIVFFYAVVMVFLSAASPAKAHEAPSGWSYPWECCSNMDCAEIAPSRVKIGAGGYVIDGRFTVPQSEARSAPDGKYHACFPKPDNLKCFFAPPSGS